MVEKEITSVFSLNIIILKLKQYLKIIKYMKGGEKCIKQ
nr:MAG TPA: hypothetical protein [Ackermannviridae sp.]